MSTPIIFPDAELWATTYLRGQLPTYGYTLWTSSSPGDAKVFVSNRRESQKTAVWIRRDGGPTLDLVRQAARLGVNIFAPTDQAATDLARTVAALFRASADGAPVLKAIESSGPSPIPDTSGPRLFMTFELTVRGVDL